MAELRTYGWSEAHRPEPAFPTERVYVWELPVRISHWVIFLSVVVLSFTGYYIHNPFIVAKSTTTFLMATMRFIHVVAGFVFIGAFLLRLYWFFMGNNWSNWRAFVPIHRRQWRGMGRMVEYYTLMLIEIITGLTMFTQVRGKWALGWLFSWIPGVIDIQHIRLTHFCIMFAFFAFVIHHVYSAVLVSWEERNGLIESIFTGYKFVPEAELEEEEEDAVLSEAD